MRPTWFGLGSIFLLMTLSLATFPGFAEEGHSRESGYRIFYRWQPRSVGESLLRVGKITEQLQAHFSSREGISGSGLYVAGNIHSSMSFGGGRDPFLIEVHVPANARVGTSPMTFPSLLLTDFHKDWYLVKRPKGIQFRPFNPCRLSSDELMHALRDSSVAARFILLQVRAYQCLEKIVPNATHQVDSIWILQVLPELIESDVWSKTVDWNHIVRGIYESRYDVTALIEIATKKQFAQEQDLTQLPVLPVINQLDNPSKLLSRLLSINFHKIDETWRERALTFTSDLITLMNPTVARILHATYQRTGIATLNPQVPTLLIEILEQSPQDYQREGALLRLREMRDFAMGFESIQKAKTDKELATALLPFKTFEEIVNRLRLTVHSELDTPIIGPATIEILLQRPPSLVGIGYFELLPSFNYYKIDWFPPGHVDQVSEASSLLLGKGLLPRIFRSMRPEDALKMRLKDRLALLAIWLKQSKVSQIDLLERLSQWLPLETKSEVLSVLQKKLSAQSRLTDAYSRMLPMLFKRFGDQLSTAEKDQLLDLIQDPEMNADIRSSLKSQSGSLVHSCRAFFSAPLKIFR